MMTDSILFHNLPIALIYLCTPYVVMLALDTYTNRLRHIEARR
jgi:hypothetical protein